MKSLRKSHKLCVGLTGGIGCGKNTVARLFEALGVPVIDTDSLSHQLTRSGGQAIAPIKAAFGEPYITKTGELDRALMRQLVFSDAGAKLKLENILHPLILALCEAELCAKAAAPYVILMAPLLLECPAFLALVDRVLLVDCSEQNQISRVASRSGLDETQIRAIIALQMPRAERMARADDFISNDGLCAELDEQVAALHRHYANITN
ncbi:MAG: dephospho-CoA kinase [Gallionella sp.]|nr:dephospho-CoA kinase [Gallionella sp.]